MVGIEVRDTIAVAVALDGQGIVGRRAERPIAADAAEAALAVVADVAPASEVSVLGVAAADPDSPAAGAALAALKSRYGASLASDRATSSGTAAAIAEAWIGAVRDACDVIYLSAGDRTIAGIVRSGAPFVGARGRAASVGWMALNPVERDDYRKTGCLEAEVAATGIVRRLVWRIKSGDDSKIQEMVNGDLTAVTIDHVLAAARAKDGVAISVMRDTARYLGMAAANLVVITDPDALVLGGMMASADDLLFESVRVEIARRLPEPMMSALALAPAALGSDAAAIGSARLAAVARR
jgi:glucokinase